MKPASYFIFFLSRCSVRQVDILATTLEPIRHRDYTVAVNHQYPTSPLKKIKPKKPAKGKKKKGGLKKKSTKTETNRDTSTYQRTLNIDGTLAGATTPDSVIDLEQERLVSKEKKSINNKLLGEQLNRKQLSTIHQERTKDLTSADLNFSSVDEYADFLASRIVSESIPQTVKIFDPSELYAQDLASTIMHEAMDKVGMFMDVKEKSILEKASKTGLLLEAGDANNNVVQSHNVETKAEVSFNQTGIYPYARHDDSDTEDTGTVKVDTAVLDKYRK